MMDWIHANVSVMHIPLLSFLTKEGKLNPFFWSLYNDLLDAARINATFVFASFIGSCNPITGSYDGLIGDLESNITDFSIQFRSYETIADPRCRIPVEFNAIYRQQNSYIISSPDTNVTKSIKHIHETLLVFDCYVTFLLSMLYLLSVIALKKSASINQIKKSSVWTLTKIWFHQDSNDDSIRIESEKTILNTSKLTLVYFIILISAFINTDLVSYSTPKLIDSVDDAIESGIRIAFPKETTTYSVLKAAEEGSIQHKILAHALGQAKKAGNSESIFLESGTRSDAIKIKERSLIVIPSEFQARISDRTDCMDTSGAINRFHKSRDAVLTEHESLFYSRSASEEIKARTRKVYTRAMEFGLFGKERQDGAIRVTDTFFPGSIVSVSCLHRDRFQSESKQDQRVRYEDFSYLMIHMASFYAICVCMLLIEWISIRFAEPIRLERMQKKRHFEIARQRRKMRMREIDLIFFVPNQQLGVADVPREN